MERKNMFLNNDLHSMLSHEQRIRHGRDTEREKQNQKTLMETRAIIENPSGLIQADEIIDRSIRHSGADEYFLKLFTEGTDEEQAKCLQNIEYTAAYTILPEAIEVAGYELIQSQDYSKWIDILLALKYVPLQKAFCFDLKSHESYVGVLKTIKSEKLVYPHTFFMALLAHWFEWICQVGGNIWSYEDLSRVYNNKRKAQTLRKEARKIREEWLENLSARISEIMDGFMAFLKPEEMLVWATKEPLRCAGNDNDFAKEHDRCLKIIWEDLVKKGALNSEPKECLNLNLLVLLSDKAVKEGNRADALTVIKHLETCLLKENFTGMGVLTIVDIERQAIIAKMLRMLYVTKEEVAKFIGGISTRFYGWNLDYQQIYKEARREAYLFCCLLMQLDSDDIQSQEKLTIWKSYLDLYLKEYRRCDNEYILRDEYALPFKLAVLIAENCLNEEGKVYLHEILIEKVLSIVTLLSIFATWDIKLSNDIINGLFSRVEKEWPSAQMLMETRGQKVLMEKIDDYVKRRINLQHQLS